MFVVVVLFVDLLLLDDWFTGVVVVCDLFWGCGDEGVGRVVGASTAAAAFGLDGEDEGFDWCSLDSTAVVAAVAAAADVNVELGDGNGVVEELVVAFKIIWLMSASCFSLSFWTNSSASLASSPSGRKGFSFSLGKKTNKHN